jgi:hypothetical protein
MLLQKLCIINNVQRDEFEIKRCVFTPLYLDTHAEGISNDKTICPEEPVLVPSLRKKRNLVNSPKIVQKGKA